MTISVPHGTFIYTSQNMTNDKVSNIVKNLPDSPGVYQYFDNEGTIIYVGKAKNLKRRVSSYFQKTNSLNFKTQTLVKQICNLKYIVVGSEQDALLLENNLIKQYQPKYNILLKDGKSYPSICITNERFPRVFKTRNIIKGAGEYYGPFSFNYVADYVLELIREIYPIRTCRTPLTEDGIKNWKYKVCLQYHIKKCSGVCEGLQSAEDYKKMIDEIKEIIKGNVEDISKLMMDDMKKLSDEMRFEEAAKLKEKYEMLEKFKSKSIIVDRALSNIDVFSYEEDDNSAYINILRVQKGSIVQGQTIEYKKKLEEEKEEILSLAIIELRNQLNSKSREVIVPFAPSTEEIEEIDGARITIPQRGDKKKLLELSEQNVKQYKVDKYKQSEKLNPEQRQMKILTALKDKLQMGKTPMTIECFDNSHISGSNAVAGCVVYKKGKPSKKDYRTYNITGNPGNDDYASMKEVVYRRYRRMMEEDTPLPDLIITDGGKGQMDAVREVTEGLLKINIPIAGLAKNDKHRTNELLFGFPPKTVGLKTTDEVFKFLTNMQDEVHRFAITFHKKKRSKRQVESELDKIKGIGKETKEKLLKEFKSVKRIKEADFDTLEKVIGKSRATVIYEYFKVQLTQRESNIQSEA